MPINHVCNLDVALNSNHGPQILPITPDDLSPANHAILFLTAAFKHPIQENNIVEITAINKLYAQTLKSNLDFILYDRSNLCATQQIAMNILNSHVAASTPLPTSPPKGRATAPPVPTTIYQFQAA